ncbi:hypothetical protein DWS18_15245 [Escherichia coli]|nr:hypothetical protein [Escherichia coli]EFO0381735.1 hypothetical protein [Escherichia coli]EFO1528429.1 hypothetical protein [Escherichia coli]EFO2707504.1 hypothetical protein [Escherichia coli]EFO3172747.1 hypothetical protein [Escherichia coli]
MVTSILMSPWPEDWILYARKSDITNGLKVTSEYWSYNVGAHNVYYVKYGGFVLKFMCSALSVA